MLYDDDFRQAAKHAVSGVRRAISSLRKRTVKREDDLSGVLKGNLDAELEGTIGHLTWDCTILDHSRGVAAEEKEFGADLLLHVRFTGRKFKYDKGVLIQSKKLEKGLEISSAGHHGLKQQCQTMLTHSASSYVWIYSTSGLRSVSAASIIDSANRDLNAQATWTDYRFFLELFRCPIGDPTIVSPYPRDLKPRVVAKITAEESAG